MLISTEVANLLIDQDLTVFQTPSFHSDHDLLERAVAALEEIIQEVDVQTGEAKCHFTYNKLEFIDEKQVCITIFSTSNPHRLYTAREFGKSRECSFSVTRL